MALRPIRKTALIIGAGPAGLTAAYELLTRTTIHPIVLEQSTYMGGISRTVNHNGNRIDIGGHRFFSKSDRVMEWWLSHLPMEEGNGNGHMITYQRKSRQVNGNGHRPSDHERVMLVRNRKSRIYFLRKFFEYPITLSPATVRNLGLWRTFRIGLSYLRRAWFPLRNVKNLEQFFINRFGSELYRTFFKSYTEKVWGVPCRDIDAEWGEQRIKKLSIGKSLLHAAQKLMPRRSNGVQQKNVETSLIERFLYPKYGPGQMWEEVARKVTEMGGEIHTQTKVARLEVGPDHRVTAVVAVRDGREQRFECDYCFSTMPMRELVRALDCPVPANVREVSEGLQYRDFITVGLLVDRLKVEDSADASRLIADNWIYIQEPDVLAGRLQIFNNWSPGMVADRSKVWIGVEYFCYETDDLWKRPDEYLTNFAAAELDKIGIIDKACVRDSTVLRMPKSYPAYFGTYTRFDELRTWLDAIPNLFLVGRNGMHKYNNQDHSMLTAMIAVDNIVEGRTDKSNLWEVNTEQDYHEAKKEEPSAQTAEAA